MTQIILSDKTPVPVNAEAIIATTQEGAVMLIHSNPNIVDLGIVADCFLDDYIEHLKPSTVYKCKIRWRSFQSNHPLDPIEYDTEVFVEDVEELHLVDKWGNILKLK